MRFHSIARLARPAAIQATPLRARTLHSTSLLRTQAGYGDPQDEKIENKTPMSQTKTDQHGHEVASGSGKPSSSADPQPEGQGKGTGTTGGTTDPEIKPLEQNANEDKKASGQEIKETKKVGEDPKKEEVGGMFLLFIAGYHRCKVLFLGAGGGSGRSTVIAASDNMERSISRACRERPPADKLRCRRHWRISSSGDRTILAQMASVVQRCTPQGMGIAGRFVQYERKEQHARIVKFCCPARGKLCN
jgi:hypothetical protein